MHNGALLLNVNYCWCFFLIKCILNPSSAFSLIPSSVRVVLKTTQTRVTTENQATPSLLSPFFVDRTKKKRFSLQWVKHLTVLLQCHCKNNWQMQSSNRRVWLISHCLPTIRNKRNLCLFNDNIKSYTRGLFEVLLGSAPPHLQQGLSLDNLT